MAIIPTLFKRCSGPLKKGATQVGSYISHECKITPSDSDASGPCGGGLTRMRPWATVYVHQALASFSSVIVLKLFSWAQSAYRIKTK